MDAKGLMTDLLISHTRFHDVNTTGLSQRLDAWLHRFSARRPCRLITGDQGEPYLERYYLIGFLGWHLYLHRFVDSDPDRGLHDHPWNRAFSLILTGGYEEIRARPSAESRAGTDAGEAALERTTRRFVGPGRLNRLRGHDYHRVVLRPGAPAWTLFLHGPRVKGWGFRRGDRVEVMARDASEFRHRDWWKEAPTGARLREQASEAPR